MFAAGDVRWFDFGRALGSEAGDVHTGVIIQADWLPDGLETVLVVPCTGKLERRRQPTCVFLPKAETGLDRDTVAVCHLLSAMDRRTVQDDGPRGRLSPKSLVSVRLMVAQVLGITTDLLLGAGGVEPDATSDGEAGQAAPASRARRRAAETASGARRGSTRATGRWVCKT
jgi:mRNA interferase MazF